MYEVFFNDNRLILVAPDKGEFLNTEGEVYIGDNPELLKDVVNQFLSSQGKTFIIKGNMEIIWPYLRTWFTELPAAGGLVASGNKYLFILRKGKWDLPKGKIDKGETPGEAALREVREETGLQDIRIIRELPSTWHIYYSAFHLPGSKPVLKQTRWFLMEAPTGQSLIPESGEDIEEARWFNSSELISVLSNTYDNLKGLIKTIMR